MNPTDPLTALRNADPARPDPAGSGDEPDDAERLAALRLRVDAQRSLTPGPSPSRSVRELASFETAPRTSWRRRVPALVALTAAVAAAPVAVSVLAPGSPADEVLTPAAVATDGTLDCGVGEAVVVAPADAEVRLLPAELPEGWTLSSVFAREESARGYCVAPSLAALRTDGETVTGTLRVSGPFTAPVELDDPEAASAATAAGRPAERFGDGDERTRSFTWLWQDVAGRQWLAAVDGYELAAAQRLVDGLTTDGDRVTWDAGAAPGLDLEVVHARTGPAYGAETDSLSWYVELGGGAAGVLGGPGDAVVSVEHDPDTAAPLAASAVVGDRLTTIGGRPALVEQGRAEERAEGEEGTDTDVPPGEPYAWVQLEVAPGTVARAGVSGDDWQPAAAVLASLEAVPADDERLARYALDEDTGSTEPTG